MMLSILYIIRCAFGPIDRSPRSCRDRFQQSFSEILETEGHVQRCLKVEKLFAALDILEDRLSTQRYLIGEILSLHNSTYGHE